MGKQNTELQADAGKLQPVVDLMLEKYPDTQAIYLYGSWGTEYQRPDSDFDLGVLLPFEKAKAVDPTHWGMELAMDIAGLVHANAVDLINLRCVPDYNLRKEIVWTGRLLYDGDELEREKFEMLATAMFHDWWDRYQRNFK